MIYDNVELYNVQEMLGDEQGGGHLLTRVPDALRVQLNHLARQYALQTAGCEIRFNLEGDTAKIRLQSPEGPALVEIYQGSFFTGWRVVSSEPTEIVVERLPASDLRTSVSQRTLQPFDPELTRVLLPWSAATRLLGIDGPLALPRPGQTPPRKYLAYGSSITQGYTGICPTDPYAQRTAYHLGVDLINLGFAGGAHLEPAMADYIADRGDWDFATLEMGINLIRGITTEEFARRVQYFVPTIARRHDDKWIFCLDLFTCGIDFEGDPRITEFREVVRETVRSLGLPRLVHISGADLLLAPAGLTYDLIHPARSGMEEIASNLTKRMADKLRAGDEQGTEGLAAHVAA